MSKRLPTNVAASVRQRLLNLSKEKNEDFTLTLVQYVAERFLYRLSKSSHAEHFILKGALLLATRVGRRYRPTRDIDFLEYGEASQGALARAVEDIASIRVEDDGLLFDLKTLEIDEIREHQEYGGLRVSMNVMLERARIPLQIDVAYGDAVVPAAMDLEYPTLLGGATPRVRAYPIETVVAEKSEAIVKLGMANSRMKDYYDLWLIAATFTFDGQVLTRAFVATFERRRTGLPSNGPVGLTDEFAQAADNVKRWRGFLEANGLDDAPKELPRVVDAVGNLILPPLRAAAARSLFEQRWSPDTNWK